MKAFHFLRVAAVLTLLYCAGHTSSMPWTPYTSAEATAVLEAMKSHSFEEQGFKGTYWDLYFGFGIAISVYLLLQAVVLWQVGALAKTDAIRVRPIVVSFLIVFVVNAALSWKYLFIIPIVLAALIAICLAIALVLSGRPPAARSDPSAKPVPAGS
ncbi:MAG TPA: hypothetical protein VEI07_10720 [Planctomycetaceae bacterium]|nr:hypothetical protein [Planctomycetaceae bacterium]